MPISMYLARVQLAQAREGFVPFGCWAGRLSFDHCCSGEYGVGNEQVIQLLHYTIPMSTLIMIMMILVPKN